MTFDTKKNILYLLCKNNIFRIFGTDLSKNPILPNTNKIFTEPIDIDINPFSQELYVTDSDKSTVIINLTNNNNNNKLIPLKYAPENILINSATNTIYESLPLGAFVAVITEKSPLPPLRVTIAYSLMYIFFHFSNTVFNLYFQK